MGRRRLGENIPPNFLRREVLPDGGYAPTLGDLVLRNLLGVPPPWTCSDDVSADRGELSASVRAAPACRVCAPRVAPCSACSAGRGSSLNRPGAEWRRCPGRRHHDQSRPGLPVAPPCPRQPARRPRACGGTASGAACRRRRHRGAATRNDRNANRFGAGPDAPRPTGRWPRHRTSIGWS